jgi:hypothetical protein
MKVVDFTTQFVDELVYGETITFAVAMRKLYNASGKVYARYDRYQLR